MAYILILDVSLWTAFSAFTQPGGIYPNSLLTTTLRDIYKGCVDYAA